MPRGKTSQAKIPRRPGWSSSATREARIRHVQRLIVAGLYIPGDTEFDLALDWSAATSPLRQENPPSPVLVSAECKPHTVQSYKVEATRRICGIAEQEMTMVIGAALAQIQSIRTMAVATGKLDTALKAIDMTAGYTRQLKEAHREVDRADEQSGPLTLDDLLPNAAAMHAAALANEGAAPPVEVAPVSVPSHASEQAPVVPQEPRMP